tara:strand:+ start:8849 stop:9874 length:1026 start_codon:yes stop_codon:yes gene_type:complete
MKMSFSIILLFLALYEVMGLNHRLGVPYKKDIHSFKTFVSDFEKDYSNDLFYKKGYMNFQKNVDFINNHNNNSTNSFSLKLNNFADEDPKTLKRNLFSFDIDVKNKEEIVNNKNTDNFFFSAKNELYKPPLSLDYRKKGAVTPVKNQGRCGSCWAFSTIGALESKYALKTGKLKNFSEQKLVDCSKSNHGCNGGFMHEAFNDLLLSDGVSLEEDYPYVGTVNPCKEAPTFKDFNFLGYNFVLSHSSKALIEALQVNPVSIALAGDPMKFLFYGEGIFDCEECSTRNNHAVLLVGYELKDDVPYWIIKNSWGEKWGEDGYIRIKMTEGDGILGMNQYGVYPY